MPTVLSPARADVQTYEGDGVDLIHRGKVRDTYRLPNGKLLIVASDGISIFDHVLNAVVAWKGAVLNALTLFWIDKLQSEMGVPTHLVAAGRAMIDLLPNSLHDNSNLMHRAMVVQPLVMVPIEFIARGYLTGSGLSMYREKGAIHGHWLAPGLEDGDELPYVLDTPTTKAEGEHDAPLDAFTERFSHPIETLRLFDIYQFARHYALSRGIVLADTKLEFGRDGSGDLMVADEILTPDSSRYWDLRDWQTSRTKSPRKAPPPFDKQLVRNWGLTHGLNKLDPGDPAAHETVQKLGVPEDLLDATSQTYRYIFWRLVGATLEQYLETRWSEPVARPTGTKVAVVFGGESDLTDTIRIALVATQSSRPGSIYSLDVHVISCHRNPEQLDRFVRNGCNGANVVIAAGGKALALPGIMTALMHKHGHPIPVIGVGLGQPGTEAYEAARLSIKELPGQPVIMDEPSGEPYMGCEGLKAALDRIACGELPPPKPYEQKLAKFSIALS